MVRHRRRGVRIYDSAQAYAKLRAASEKCTSSRRLDPNAFFRSPTGAHLAPFILPWPGRRSAPRRPCAIPRQTTIQQKLRSTISAAGFAQVHCSRHAESLATARAGCVTKSGYARRRSCGRLCPFFAERTQEWATSRPWYRPVLWIADVSADIAIATRLTLSEHWPSAFQVPLRPITLPTLARRG